MGFTRSLLPMMQLMGKYTCGSLLVGGLVGGGLGIDAF